MNNEKDWWHSGKNSGPLSPLPNSWHKGFCSGLVGSGVKWFLMKRAGRFWGVLSFYEQPEEFNNILADLASRLPG